LRLIRRRIAVVAGATVGVAGVATLAVLIIASAPLASANRATHAQLAARAATSAFHPILTPLKPIQPGVKPALAPRDPDSDSPWTPLVNPPPFGTPGTMLLESDGTVLVHNEPDNNTIAATSDWWKLTPDSSGNYADGTWTQIASMPANYAPLYFGSAILPDGRMIVEGGEYNGENAVWTNQGEIYDPVTNSWRSVPPPPGWTNIGDAASVVLDDGTFMLQHPCNTCLTDPEPTVDDALLNAKNLSWKVIPATGKEDPNDEEGWTLEPSGQVLTVDTWAAVGGSSLFNPGSNTWTFSGAEAPNGYPLNPWPVVEIGPQAEVPGGNVFVVGAGTSTDEYPNPCTTNAPTQTALYDYKAGTPGTWAAGPEIPTIDHEQYASTDGPAATLPDGNILFDASACTYNIPTHFWIYNTASSSLTQIPDAPNAENDTSYQTRMLDLPNGQVLYNDGSSDMEVYTGSGAPKPAWAPSIRSLSDTDLNRGGTYSLSGKQLSGLDPGAVYGDDVQDNTNFPLVRITNNATGTVTYARTHDWSSVSVAPGTSSSTEFTIPRSTPRGRSALVVIANGIASAPRTVTIS
jgi:Kelch motif